MTTEYKRDINRAMYDYIPDYYEDIREARAIIDTGSSKLETLNYDIQDVLNQFFVSTATWALPQWEKLVGLPINVNYSSWDAIVKQKVLFDDVEGREWDYIEKAFAPEIRERRSAILAKINGYGTITKQKLMEICGVYSTGKVKITEFPKEFRLLIEFIDEVGVPKEIDTLKKVLREVIPAHLTIDYSYRFLKWDDLDNFKWSFNVLDGKKLSWDELSLMVVI